MLYTIPTFVRAILTTEIHIDEEKKNGEEGKNNEGNGIDQQIEKRLKASKKLVLETKKLFATLSLGDKKYTDPSAVLHSIVDDYGNPIQIGEQKDIGEFNSTFLARIQEGLHADYLLEKLRKEHV
jgi:ubiquitin carboxyl-terminal hydrolase 25/28